MTKIVFKWVFHKVLQFKNVICLLRQIILLLIKTKVADFVFTNN